MTLSTSTWVSQTNGLVYERPLGITESSFYWDSVFNGTADTLDSSELEIDSLRFDEVISLSNISRTWCALKQRFPLIGATIEERNPHDLFFVVSPDNLNRIRHPEEVVIRDVTSAQEAQDFAHSVVVNKRQLSNDLLGRMWILKRSDTKNTCHIIFHLAHSITDGMSNITVKKTFLDILCGGASNPPDFIRQLVLSESSQHLYPTLRYTPARRRWRTAIAKIIALRRSHRLTGGHTLPRKISEVTPFTPADSRTIVHVFTEEQTQHIIATCRKNKLTFGNAYPIIGQMATTRILLRRYLRGDISEAEWEFRKREPMLSAGPLNLRPFLDKEWLDAGGHSHVCVSIGFMYFSLPFMPLGAAANLRPGAPMPSFWDLLSRKRFMLRSQSIKQQSKDYMKHPLFIEFGANGLPLRLERTRELVTYWRDHKAPPKQLSSTLLSPVEQASRGPVFGNGGSSMGNVDLLFPREYPLARQASERPTILVKNGATRLHCRPTELYLGASTTQGRLRLMVHWDNNVIEEDIVTEWLQEVKNAIELYLVEGDIPKIRL